MRRYLEASLRMHAFLYRFFACDSGATTIEYALMVGGIGATLALSIGNWASAVEAQFVRARNILP